MFFSPAKTAALLERLPWIIVIILLLVILTLISSNSGGQQQQQQLKQKFHSKTVTWRGGDFVGNGNCWCGQDSYCLCTPSLAIDLIIETDDGKSILLVKRKDSGKYATMGGYVDVGEDVEAAVARELKEETNLDLDSSSLHLVGVYGDPKRDPRRHTVSITYRVAKVQGSPRAGDDVKEVEVVPIPKLKSIKISQFAFDHSTIIYDYLRKFHPEHAPTKSDEEAAGQKTFSRSKC